ncbi:reverse transcriptase domain-containing protein [Tanacetum coccineum]
MNLIPTSWLRMRVASITENSMMQLVQTISLYHDMFRCFELLVGNEYCLLTDSLATFRSRVDPLYQEKYLHTAYRTFAYLRMPFGLCNAPGTFQRCMVAIFHDMIEKTMEVFMDDFSVFGDSFSSCLSHLDKMLQSVKTQSCAKLVKSTLMSRQHILGYKNTKSGSRLINQKLMSLQNYLIPLTSEGYSQFFSDTAQILPTIYLGFFQNRPAYDPPP